MPPSSATFETILTPDARLRRAVRLYAWLAAVAGAVIVIAMPVAWQLRFLLALAWVFECMRELKAMARGSARLDALRLDAAGNAVGFGPAGGPEPLCLLSGSMVLKRLAWLRLRFADGSTHGELFAGEPGSDPAWHRLQLIWRLNRRAFGRPEGS